MEDNRRRVFHGLQARVYAAVILIAFGFGLSGCGTNFNELLYQAASSVGRTAFDLWLTDQVNQIADSDQDADDQDPDDGDGVDDGDADDGDGADGDGVDDGDSDGDTGSGDGDPVAGEAAYTANGCAACHCADGIGGCALAAPSLIGVDAATLDDYLRGDASHPSKADLSDGQLADLEAYLASVGG